MPNRFTLVDDVAGDGQSVVDADGAVMARAAKKTKVSTLALMAVLGMINLSSEISARAANAKTELSILLCWALPLLCKYRLTP